MSWPKPYASCFMLAQKKTPVKLNAKRYYNYKLEQHAKTGTNAQVVRLIGESKWHEDCRPYFRVYPIIERKLSNLTGKTTVAEMRMPYESIEINTRSRSMLLYKTDQYCVLIMEPENVEGFLICDVDIKSTVSEIVTESNDVAGCEKMDKEAREFVSACVRIAVGVCLLANDPKIVSPVILDKHRRDDMTAQEMARRAAQAISRTGRVGFDVGREIERMPVSSHYRTGHPAIYYVGKSHENYPRNGLLNREPVLLWRSGAIVNADRVTEVPTGFHG